jgi:hypothetical protein
METTRTLRQSAIQLPLASFIVLFQELTLIRWMSAEVRVLAYFPNVVLISAFLGLGIGSMRAGKRSLLWLWPISLVALVAATLLMNRVAFTSRSATEHLWLLYYDIPNAPVVNDVRPPIIAAFVFTAISFLSLGQIVGERLQDFTQAGSPLRGYAADLTGSLFGVILFTIASFTRTFPALLVCGVSIRRRVAISFAQCPGCGYLRGDCDGSCHFSVEDRTVDGL